MGKLCKLIALTLIFPLVMCGCESVLRFLNDPGGSGEAINPEAIPQFWDGQAHIRPGVGLIVQVAAQGQPVKEMEAMVDQNGDLTLPYLLTEPVACDGLTLDSFRQKLIKVYQRFIKQPQVTVRFAPFDLRTGTSPYGTVNVLGEVVLPGPVNMPPTMDLTVTKALQAAGNLKPFADKRKIQVTRCERDGTLRKSWVDLVEIGEKGRIDKDMPLKPGDVVYVHEAIW